LLYLYNMRWAPLTPLLGEPDSVPPAPADHPPRQDKPFEM